MQNLFKRRIKNEKGFTLVELLVVVAIIGILAAVVAPNVFAQIEKGRVSQVQADYNAVKTATLVYFADEGAMPANLTALVEANHLDSTPKAPWSSGAYSIEVVGGVTYLQLTQVPESARDTLLGDFGGIATAQGNSAIRIILSR